MFLVSSWWNQGAPDTSYTPRAAPLCQESSMCNTAIVLRPSAQFQKEKLMTLPWSVVGPSRDPHTSLMFKVRDGLSWAPHEETHTMEGSGWHCT